MIRYNSLVLLTGNTPLLAAASEGHTDIVRILLDAGSNPLTVNNSGSTGLHMAAYQRNATLLKVLWSLKRFNQFSNALITV